MLQYIGGLNYDKKKRPKWKAWNIHRKISTWIHLIGNSIRINIFYYSWGTHQPTFQYQYQYQLIALIRTDFFVSFFLSFLSFVRSKWNGNCDTFTLVSETILNPIYLRIYSVICALSHKHFFFFFPYSVNLFDRWHFIYRLNDGKRMKNRSKNWWIAELEVAK